MKRIIVALTVALLLVSAVGCGQSAPVAESEPESTTTARATTTTAPQVTETVQGNMKTYEKLSDNTWKCDGQTYHYRLEITGRMHSAAKDSTFTYLSNLESITFEQAWKAAGLSSNMNDYFDPKDAVLVDMQ
ncbi:MAG: immunogenic protein [Clostridia bacterium]|nr:immunogenic protein [Clostridia bacterium]